MMTGMDITEIAETVTDAVRDHIQPVLIGAGAVGTLIGLWTIWRWWTRGETHTRMGVLAVVLATGIAGEGMWEVARYELALPPYLAGALFAFLEVVMLSQGAMARYKLRAGQEPAARRHMGFVWAAASASGLIAASAGESLTEVLLRLIAPPVAAGIVWMELTADQAADRPRQQTSWIWTPRRIGIRLGWIAPGEEDLVQVDRNHRIDAITVTAHRLHHGSPRLRRWRRAKLRRLALQADDAMVAEARRRVARVHQIEMLTAPDAAPVDPVDDRTRAALDEIRLQTRETARRLRAQMPRPDAWSNNVVRIPTRLVDQGWAAPTDQDLVRWLDQRRDQQSDQTVDHAPVQTADQTVDQAADQTEGTESDQTTDQPARVDQQVNGRSKRRSTPPTDSTIPPRIQQMARELRRRYRGEIPPRAEVMRVLGWTSADYASKAINLVRAERTRTDQTDPDPDRAAV